MNQEAASLRVLLVNRALPEHVAGGLERHTADLAEGLAAFGCEVHWLCAPFDDATGHDYDRRGVQLHVNSCAAPSNYTINYLKKTPELVRAVARETGADIIHGQEFALGAWRRRAGDPPVAMTVHGTITSETPLHPDVWMTLDAGEKLRALARFGRRFLFAPAWRRTLSGADCLMVDSGFSRGELERLFPALALKIRLVPLGAKLDAAPPPDRAAARAALDWKGTQLLTFGRLVWQKGHAIAIEALASMPELDWRYTIAGEGGERPALKALAARLGVADRVTFTGRVDEQTKAQMLSGADLFLWPERTHPAFGLTGLEAMLHGTPVLATRRGAIPEVLGAEGGWLAERPGARVFAEALSPLLSSPARLAEKRPGLRKAALARLNFDAMIRAVLDVYSEILTKS